MTKTLDYYNSHAEEYRDDTVNVSMKYSYDRFQFYLPETGKLLDFSFEPGVEIFPAGNQDKGQRQNMGEHVGEHYNHHIYSKQNNWHGPSRLRLFVG